jgi:S1-C subfamily serine protease
MFGLACVLLIPGQIETVPSVDFPKKAQMAAIAATMRVVNVSKRGEGSGVIVGRKGPFVYILTAQHVVDGGERLEVATFSATSYPRPHRRYRTVSVVAKAGDLRDLALLRLTTNDPMPGSLSLCPARLVPDGKRLAALTVGCSGGEAPTCQVDEVVGKKLARREAGGKTAYFWEVAQAPAEGRSGGPLVDQRGYLLGVCSGTNKGKAYFCHTDEVRAFLKQSGFDWLN